MTPPTRSPFLEKWSCENLSRAKKKKDLPHRKQSAKTLTAYIYNHLHIL